MIVFFLIRPKCIFTWPQGGSKATEVQECIYGVRNKTENTKSKADGLCASILITFSSLETCVLPYTTRTRLGLILKFPEDRKIIKSLHFLHFCFTLASYVSTLTSLCPVVVLALL